VQRILPLGNAAPAQKDARTTLETLGRGAIASPTYPMQPDTPMENFWAMLHDLAPYCTGIADLSRMTVNSRIRSRSFRCIA